MDQDRVDPTLPTGNSGMPFRELNGAMVRLTGSARLLILFAIVGLFMAAATLLVYGTLLVFDTAWNVVRERTLTETGLNELVVLFIKLTDAFLLGCVLIIVALGLYQLFVDADLPLSPWLRITSIDQLKSKLLGVIVVLLSVAFVGVVVQWNGDAILELGLSVAAVIVAVSVFLAVPQARDDKPPHDPD